MRVLVRLLTTVLCLVMLLALSGCTKISLSGSTAGKSGSSSAPGGTKPGAALDGPWTIQFEYGGEAYESQVDLAVSGNQLVGQGTDANGNAFFIDKGKIEGDKVAFSKKYAGADPTRPSVDYVGTVSFKDIADYHGWIMEGHYKTAVKGKAVEGKWVATPENVAPQPQEQAQQGPPPGQQEGPAEEVPSGNGNPHLSGHYKGSYEFNFKKVQFKMWLEQDGEHIRGHGVDTNTNERFVITKGWYNYPKITMIRHYDKGKNAAATRDITFKGQVARNLTFKGETQYGGDWDARVVR